MGGNGTDFAAGYVTRVVDGELDELLPALPAILLDGPKGVGKTATALRRAATVRRLDEPEQQALGQADVTTLLTGDEPILLDEHQRVPPIWDAVKRAVDASVRGGRFLLTGSAASATETHSGAARITNVRMYPLTLTERGFADPTVSFGQALRDPSGEPVRGHTTRALADYTGEIIRSGFPGMRHLEGRPLRAQLDSYLDRIATRDMSEAGLTVRRPATVLAWLRAYAAATSSTTSYDKIRNAAMPGEGVKPAKTTTAPYRDILTDLRIIDPVPAWLPTLNHLTQLTQTPKHHLADPALAARLLGQTTESLLEDAGGTAAVRDGTLLGALFESLATLSVRVFAQANEARTYHLRTKGGRHEVDLIVERPDGRVLAIEVKLAQTIADNDVKHLTWLRDQLGDRLIDALVLTAGTTAYRRPDGVAVVPLALLGP